MKKPKTRKLYILSMWAHMKFTETRNLKSYNGMMVEKKILCMRNFSVTHAGHFFFLPPGLNYHPIPLLFDLWFRVYGYE